jgi:6-pyruvoyltetrahydropterin/6-carboxytetrahydropterin synthase
MLLTISRRFEISSSRRVVRPDFSERDNQIWYGPVSGGKHGHGFNGVVHLVFSGPVDPITGMMINVSVVKARVVELLSQKYDHRYLNIDTPPFDHLPPTAANLARQILADAGPLFADTAAKPCACHVEDTDLSSATAFADGRVEEHHWLSFSAARSTRSPQLSDQENAELFGVAAAKSGHGHNYRLRITLSGDFQIEIGTYAAHATRDGKLGAFREQLDHKNLNFDISQLASSPTTTESLVRYSFQQLRTSLPVARVQLFEMDNFFARYDASGQFRLGFADSFNAAHRLNSDKLSEADNFKTYGKCANPSGHGHQYRVEATIGGEYDERSGTLSRLDSFSKAVRQSIEPWNYKHLNLETTDFEGIPTTGENIIGRLWDRLDPLVERKLVCLRLWETPNNRFTLRRD